jgi:histidyl-tRNA synthetase
MTDANKVGVPFVVLLGEDGVAENKCSVKNMVTREQQKLTTGEVAAYIRAALAAQEGTVILEK